MEWFLGEILLFQFFGSDMGYFDLQIYTNLHI